jgi:hypothetical protein
MLGQQVVEAMPGKGKSPGEASRRRAGEQGLKEAARTARRQVVAAPDPFWRKNHSV